MIDSIFHATSPEVEVAPAFEAAGMVPLSTWAKGDRRAGGRVHTRHGCSLCISEADDWPVHLREILRFLESHSAFLRRLRDLGAELSVDIGTTIGSSRHFSRSLRFPPSALQQLAEAGIEVSISAYPCAEDSR